MFFVAQISPSAVDTTKIRRGRPWAALRRRGHARRAHGDRAAYHPSMALAVVWHFWLGLFLVIAAVSMIPAIVVGYLNKVVRPKYPSRGPASSRTNRRARGDTA